MLGLEVGSGFGLVLGLGLGLGLRLMLGLVLGLGPGLVSAPVDGPRLGSVEIDRARVRCCYGVGLSRKIDWNQ